MSLSLLSYNQCSFPNCNLHFASTNDLIAHIEFAHIPLVIEENRKKGPTPAVEDSRVTVAPNMPLSCFQRVFPTPYRPIPVHYQPVKISFNHYRRRPPPPPINIVPQQTSLTSFVLAPKKEEIHHEDSEECAPGDPEMRWRCNWLDCPKRFKSGPALRDHLRMHMRNAHHAAQIAHTHVEEQNHQHPTSIAAALESSSVASPTKYAQSRPHKCSQCSKRYKTLQGLQNHVSQAHQKLNGSRTPDANSPSPAALAQLILQKTQTQGHQSERQNYTQSSRPLPVSLATSTQPMDRPTNSPHQGHLPVRSFQVQQGRMQSQQMQTTGQMLKQQMQQLMQQPNQQLPQQGQSSFPHTQQQQQPYGLEQLHHSDAALPSAFGAQNRNRMGNQSQEQISEIKPFV